MPVSDVFTLVSSPNVTCRIVSPVFRAYVGTYDIFVNFSGCIACEPHAVAIVEDARNFSFVHLTDVHIQNRTSNSEDRLLNLSMELNLRSPTFGILTGDTCDNLLYATEEEFERAYNRLRSILLRFDFPIFVVSGNHDNFHGAISTFRRIINPIPDYSFSVGSVHFIGLDSGGPTGPYGDNILGLEGKGLTDAQMAWLASDLSSNRNASEKIIFMHHPAIADDPSASTGYQEQTISQNRAEFISLCVEEDVSLVLTGHTHEDNSYTSDGIKESGNASFAFPLFVQTRTSCASSVNSSNGYRFVEVQNGKVVSYSYDSDGDGTKDAYHSYPYQGLEHSLMQPWNETIPCSGFVVVNSSLSERVNCSAEFYLSSDYSYSYSRGAISEAIKLDGIQAQYLKIGFVIEPHERANVTIFTSTMTPDITIYECDVGLFPSSMQAGERAAVRAMAHSLSFIGNTRVRFELIVEGFASSQIDYYENEAIEYQEYNATYNFSGDQYATFEFVAPHIGSVSLLIIALDINEKNIANDRVWLSFEANLRPTLRTSVTNGSSFRTFENVAFDASSSFDRDCEALYSCVWDFGDGAHFFGLVAQHAYDKKGDYEVWVEISDMQGAKANASISIIVVNTPPIAAFSFFPERPMTREVILFSADGSYDVDGHIPSANYAWRITFSPSRACDCDSSVVMYDQIGKYVNLSFDSPGTVTARLSVTDDDCAIATMTRTIEVANRAPVCSFFYSRECDSKTILANETLAFESSGSDSDGNITAWTWDFGDGCTLDTREGILQGMSISYGKCTVMHSYSRPGSYVVELTAYDDCNGTAKCFKTIVVANAPPNARITYSIGDEWHDAPSSMLIIPSSSALRFSSECSNDPDGEISNVKWTLQVRENEKFRDISTSISQRYAPGRALAGTYAVVLDVYDSLGASNSTCMQFFVENPPSPERTYGQLLIVGMCAAFVVVIGLAIFVRKRRQGEMEKKIRTRSKKKLRR